MKLRREAVLPWVLLVIGHWSLVISAPCAEAGFFSQLISRDVEISIGLSAVASFDAEYGPYTDEAQNQRLHDISSRLLGVVDRKDLPWSVKALNSDDINAFALPGGQARVFRGLLEFTNDNELAYVLGHEFGHVDRRHGARMISKAIVSDVLLLAINRGARPPFLQDLAVNLVLMGYSREYEDEADYRAVRYLFLAGFSLDGGVSLLRKFEAMNPGERGPLHYLASHPNPAERIAAIQRHDIPAVILEFGDKRPLSNPPHVLVLPLRLRGDDPDDWAHFFPRRLVEQVEHCGLARVEAFDPAQQGIDLRWRSRWIRKAQEMGADFLVAPHAEQFDIELRSSPATARETRLRVDGSLVVDLIRVEDGQQVASFPVRVTPAEETYAQEIDRVREQHAEEIKQRVESSLDDAVQWTALDVVSYFYPRWAEQESQRASVRMREEGRGKPSKGQ